MKIVNIAIAIIYNSNGQILIALRRDNTHLGNLWEFPGGKIEVGESPEEAVVREVMEECGIHIQIINMWEIIEYIYVDKTIRLYPFTCNLISGIPESLGNEQIKWVNANELQLYEFPSANKTIIERLVGPVL